MRKIALFAKKIQDRDIEFLGSFIQMLERCEGVKLYANAYLWHIWSEREKTKQWEVYDENVVQADVFDFVFSLGGDGTLLDTIRFIGSSGTPVLGINLGHLGFLTGVKQEDAIVEVSEILRGDYQTEKRILIGIESSSALFSKIFSFALNDITIFKKDGSSLISVDVELNGRSVNNYYGDGVIFSTPTGSTAYSLSCGGPILLPEADNILITPIASHTLTVRPLVLSGDACIKVILRDFIPFNLSLDSKIYGFEGNAEFFVRKKEFSIVTIKPKNRCFFDNIREKLMWGAGARR